MNPRDEADSVERPDRAEGDSLDALLAQAAWPDPRRGQLARLRSRWRKLTAPRRSRWWLAAAAASLVVGGALWHAVENRRQFDRPVAERTEPDRPLVEDPATSTGAAIDADVVEASPDSPVPTALREGSRPPNDYERLVLASVIRQQQSLPTPRRRMEQAALLAEMLDTLAADGAADAETLAATLISERERYERLLLDVVSLPNDQRQAAALRLLPHLATWRSVPVLRALAASGQAAGPAKRALARLGTPAEAAWLVEAEEDRKLRIELLTVLAERGERQAVQLFLRFVGDARSADDALKAVDAIGEPPLDALFAALVGNDVRQRQAAAQALGRINGPAVTTRLVALALEGIYRQEAMLALVACRGAEARAFVQQARQDLTLVAAVQAAEFQFRQFSHSDPRNIP